MMRTRALLSFVLLLLLTACAEAAELVVIVNPGSGVDRLTKAEVVNIFMGRYKKFASGVSALPVDLAGEQNEKERFYSSLVGMQLAEINSYWARVMFSGRGTPPRQMDTAAEVIEVVSNNKGAIGYIDRTRLDARVRVVYEMPR
jgi:ABC-type phosphate transport system substrate-binding protein